MGKAPAFQFYPADWLNDIKLQSCSLQAQGLLVNLMCLMHQSDKYGYLLINGINPPPKVLLKLLRFDPEKPQKRFQKWLQELIEWGVLQKTDEGVYFCKRMVKDEALRQVRRRAGKKGGNPNLLNQKDNQEVNQVSNQNPTPSSSSSSSSSKKNKDYSPDSSEFQLSDLLLSYIYERNKNFKEPNMQEWSLCIDRMIRLDKRDPTQIERVIVWCQQDEFWQNNILSTDKLRKQYDKLFMKMNQKPQKKGFSSERLMKNLAEVDLD